MTATNDDDAGEREHRPHTDPREQLGGQAPEPQANDFFDW
jgi:hypothetical protein